MFWGSACGEKWLEKDQGCRESVYEWMEVMDAPHWPQERQKAFSSAFGLFSKLPLHDILEEVFGVSLV